MTKIRAVFVDISSQLFVSRS